MALEISRADGCYLYDPDEKAYLDLIAGIGVSSLGHRHPRVIAAVQDQLDRYLHTMVYGEMILSPQVRLAQAISELLPDPLDCVYFVNSGSEATEGAMKLCRKATGRIEIISARKAYHGSTLGASSLMWPTTFTQAFHPMVPGVRHIEYNDPAALPQITRQTAGVVLETVQGEWGLRPPKPDWIQAIRARCTETGTLLILDEIQAGYGRTGRFFAFEHYGIQPDVLLLAKGMGGGMPLAAIVASREKMQVLSQDPVLGHITTFGGHPVNCAAGLATLEVLRDEDWIDQVPQKEALLLEELQHPAIREVRHMGLWAAVDLGDAQKVQQVIQAMLQRGAIIDWFLFNEASLRIAPPLIISEQEIRQAGQMLRDSLDECGA